MFIKEGVEEKEYEIHKKVYELGIVNVPRIHSYEKKRLIMERITNDCLSNIYGENISEIPKIKLIKVREIIRLLYENGIEYPDITGYNFMEDKNGDIWIIDFGHANFIDKKWKVDPFIIDFINGENDWNPEFK